MVVIPARSGFHAVPALGTAAGSPHPAPSPQRLVRAFWSTPSRPRAGGRGVCSGLLQQPKALGRGWSQDLFLSFPLFGWL